MSAEMSTVTTSSYEVQGQTAHGTSDEETFSEDDWSTTGYPGHPSTLSEARSTSTLNNLDMVYSTGTSYPKFISGFTSRHRTSHRSSHGIKTKKSDVARRTTARMQRNRGPMTAKPNRRSGPHLKRTHAHGHKTGGSREGTTLQDLSYGSRRPKTRSYPRTSASSRGAKIPAPATHGSSRKTANGSHAHTTKSPVEKKFDKAISALIAELRRKSAVAYEHSKARWFSPSEQFRQHLMWLGFLAPLAILCAYITFVIVSRNTVSQPGGSDRSFRAPVPPKSRRLSIAELRRKVPAEVAVSTALNHTVELCNMMIFGIVLSDSPSGTHDVVYASADGSRWHMGDSCSVQFNVTFVNEKGSCYVDGQNWIRRRRPVNQCYDEFDKKDFHQAGPLVLTKELKGDVKFSDVPSNEIVQVQYDKDLNEMVNIGTKVEVIPPTEPATALSVEDKEKKEMPKTHRVATGDEKATAMQAVQATEADTDKETQLGGESSTELRTGMGSFKTKLEDNTEIEPKELTATTPSPAVKPEKLSSRLPAKKSGLFKAAKRRKPSQRRTEKVDPTEPDLETGLGR